MRAFFFVFFFFTSLPSTRLERKKKTLIPAFSRKREKEQAEEAE